jgi:cell division protein FtsB
MKHQQLRILSLLILIILVGYFFVSLVTGFFHNKKILQRYTEIQKRYEAVVRRNQELKAKLRQVHSDAFIEVTARDKLGLVRPGEVAYKIVKED